MAVYQKENDQLTPNAGLGIIDKVLNKFSNHAVSNKAVSEEFERINQHLTDKVSGNETLIATLSTTSQSVDVTPYKFIEIDLIATDGTLGGSTFITATKFNAQYQIAIQFADSGRILITKDTNGWKITNNVVNATVKIYGVN